MLTEFSLNPKEAEASKAFVHKHMALHAECCGASCHCSEKTPRFSYVFTPTGIGNHVKIVENISGTEQDITDYESW